MCHVVIIHMVLNLIIWITCFEMYIIFTWQTRSIVLQCYIDPGSYRIFFRRSMFKLDQKLILQSCNSHLVFSLSCPHKLATTWFLIVRTCVMRCLQFVSFCNHSTTINSIVIKKNQIRCTLFYFTKFANFTLESAQEHGRQGSAASKVLRTSDADFPGSRFRPT
jgi:hypothetical protein